MYQFIIALIITMFTSAAYATPTTKMGFRAYTSADPVTCGIFGTQGFNHYNSGNFVQVNTPDIDYSRIYNLGTKGMANYSTNNVKVVRWTCTKTGTNTPVSVKVFLNGLETHFLTLSEGTLGISK